MNLDKQAKIEDWETLAKWIRALVETTRWARIWFDNGYGIRVFQKSQRKNQAQFKINVPLGKLGYLVMFCMC